MEEKKPEIIEIKWIGRGGQGAVTASNILATAAYMEGFKGVQAFPFFGAERRGAPVSAFTRLSSREIWIRSLIYEPDIVVVLDPLLPRQINVTAGLKEGGCVILNTPQKPGEVGLKGRFRVATVDATGISEELNLKVAGMPVYNTPMLGAFSKATNIVSLESIKKAIIRYFGEKKGKLNVEAAEIAYERTVVETVSGSSPTLTVTNGGGLEIRSIQDLPITPTARPTKYPMGAPTGTWRVYRPVLDREKCTKCALCWLYCPDAAISMDEEGYPSFDYEYCKGCGVCANECRVGAIKLVREA